MPIAPIVMLAREEAVDVAEREPGVVERARARTRP